MSAIATFRIVNTATLEKLKVKAGQGKNMCFDYLESNSRKLKSFDRPGYIFAHLLIFLEERDIVMLKGAYHDLSEELSELCENSILILTPEHKREYLEGLVPENFSIDELVRFNVDFSGVEDTELAYAEMEGIRALHDGLTQLADEGEVLMLSVG